MAATRSRIEIEIHAAVEGFRDAVRGAEVQLRLMARAVDDNEKAFSRLGTTIAFAGKALLAIGSVGSAIQFIVGLTASLSNLVPIVALAPAALFTLGAAFATFKLATAGFGDALKGNADALAKLAPSARDTVTAINALKPAFDNLRKSVQQEFFKNFAADVKTLGSVFLPILARQLPQIADGFNAMGRSITRALTTGTAPKDLEKAFANTARFIDNASNAAGHLIAGLTPLIAFGSEYIPAVGIAIDGAADRFRVWAQQVTSDGSLRTFVDGAITEFGFLRDLIGNIGEIFGAVFRGLSQGAAQDFILTLAQTTQALADFLNQAETQQALAALGKAFTEVSAVTRTVFLEALKQLAPIIVELAPVVAEIARVIGATLVNALQIVGPMLLQFARFLNDNKQVIADLAPLVLGLWAAFKGASALNSAITALRGLSRALGGPVALLKGGGIIALGALAVKLDEINKAAAAKEGRGLTDMEDTLDNIVGAGQEIVTLDFSGIFSDIGDEFTQLHDSFVSGESPIGAFAIGLRDATTAAGDFVANVATTIGNFFSVTLPAQAQTVQTSIVNALTTATTAVSTFFTTTIPTLVGDFFTSIGTGISTGASNIGTSVADQFTVIVESVKTKVQEIVTAITTFLSQTPYQMGLAIGTAIADMINRIIAFGAQLRDNVVQFMTDFANNIQTGVTNAATFLSELPGRAATALAALPQTLADKATEAGNAFLTWIDSFFTQTTDRAAQVPDQVGGAVSGTVDTVTQVAIRAGAGFIQTLTDAFNNTINFATTVPGKIGSAISGLVATMITKATEAGKGFLDTITKFGNDAIIFIASLPGRILAAIGNLGGLLVGAGKSLMDGLLSGIKSAYQDVKDFVSGIADGLKAIKGPIPYDRVVLRPAGLALMAGLLDGLRTGTNDVLSFASAIAPQIAKQVRGDLTVGALSVSTLPPSAGAALASAQTSSTDRLIAALGQTGVEVNVLLDGQPFAAMVTTAVASQDRETARRVRAGGGTSW